MKVLFITPRFDEYTGGDGLYAFHLAHQLSLCKEDVGIFTISESSFVFLLYTASHESGVPSFQKILESPRGHSLTELNFYSRKAAIFFKQLVRIFLPDIIHIHGIHQYFTLSVLLQLKKIRIPVIFTVHDYKFLCGNAGFFSNRTNGVCIKCITGKTIPPIFERCKKNSLIESLGASVQMSTWKITGALKVISAFHCGSSFVYELLKTKSRLKNELIRIRMPILKNPAEVVSDHAKEINLVYIGRFVEHKGPLLFAESVKRIDHVKIDLFGDGPLLDKAKQLLAGKDNVVFHGWKPHAVIREHITTTTIVVVPYLTLETFCYVVLESMLLGSCVVAFHKGAIPELITHGVNGILLEDETGESLYGALLELLSNKPKVISLGREALKIREVIDTLPVHTEKLINSYRQLILAHPKVTRL